MCIRFQSVKTESRECETHPNVKHIVTTEVSEVKCGVFSLRLQHSKMRLIQESKRIKWDLSCQRECGCHLKNKFFSPVCRFTVKMRKKIFHTRKSFVVY